jgi:endonuclease/exonuclease/phosphatase family metal-dependent hydrolase
MRGKPRLLVKRLFIILNVVAAVIFGLACIAPYLNPTRWWIISFLGLGFAGLLGTLLLFAIFWLFTRPRYAFISLVAMILGWKSISVFFAFHKTESFTGRKAPGALRVVHWNVARFIEWKRNNNEGSQKRLRMMDDLKAQHADVLCLVEFFHSTDSVYYDNLNYIREKMGYPYVCYSWIDDGYKQWVGEAIFSKHPIIDSGVTRFPRPGLPETLIHADIVRGPDTIRIYTTHLQSFRFGKEDYERIEKIKNRDDSLLENSRNIFSKVKTATVIRSRQADIVRAETDRSPYPFILTGDLNDVPNSYTYFTIRGNLQDVFLKKELGIGSTFHGLSPTLRIDYILATAQFEPVQFNRVSHDLSDHDMLVADLRLSK